MYIDAICKGIDDIPTVDNETRQMMMEKYEKEGLERLCAELKLLDPEYYSIVDLKNPKRVIHALEIKIGLCRDREELYDRINKRVDIMINDGLVDEVKSVYQYKNLNSLNTVGYKEIIQYLEGNCTLEFAIEKIKQNSRIYSRKQMTWFKRDNEIIWFHPDREDEIMEYIEAERGK